MSPPGLPELVAILAAAGGFLAAVALILPVARRSLGLIHPGVVWLAAHAVFFGVGSVTLALIDRIPGPALFVGGAAAAAGVGVWLGDRLDRRRSGAGPTDRDAGEPGRPRSLIVEDPRRRPVVPVLALASIVAIVPVLVTTGIPVLSGDITAARTEITGIPIQLIRVALPALAAVWLLDTVAGRPPAGRPALAWLTLGLTLAFTAALANRYLPLELAATVVIAWLLAGRPIPSRAAAIAVVLAGVVFVGFGVVRSTDRTGSGPVAVAVERTVSRVFLVQPRTIAALQERIPTDEPFFLGSTWLRRLGPIIGRDIPNLGYWIYPDVVAGEQATAGYAAPGLLGEAWANFGPAGLSLFVLLGFGCQRLGALIASRRDRVVDIVAGAASILFVARTHALGLMGLTLLLGLVLAWRWLAGADAGLWREIRVAIGWRRAVDDGAVTARN